MPLLDLETLLAPIPGLLPSGTNLRYEPVFDELRELRREDDPQAPRGIWRSKLKVADWAAVIARAEATLASASKDLQIAAWLAEALVARYGMPGATAGFGLLAGLVERFWPVLWPAAGDDEEEDARLTVLDWLDARLNERLLMLPVAEAGEPVPSWHEQTSLQRRRAGNQGHPAPEDDERQTAITKAIARSSDAWYLRLLAELRAAEAGLAALLAALRDAGCASPPAFAQLRGGFGAMGAFLHAELTSRAVPHGQGTAAEPDPPVVLPSAPAPAAVPSLPVGTGGLTSREAAYRRLEEIAQYLEMQEPHSPVPALLRRAIAWGGMRLPELLAELVQEQGGPFRLLKLDTPRAAE